MDANVKTGIEQKTRSRLLDPVDRISEILFGLIMAVTFVGSISVATAGSEDVRTATASALGCNLAWGLVDAVMYLVRTVTDRGRLLTLIRTVQADSNAETGRRLIERSISRVAAGLLSPAEIEAVRGRIVALPSLPPRPRLRPDDFLAAFAIFLIVVASTFPVVLPFLLVPDVGTAKVVSRVLTLTMLFIGGLALGRYAGYGSWKAGIMMVGLGTALVAAVIALGG